MLNAATRPAAPSRIFFIVHSGLFFASVGPQKRFHRQRPPKRSKIRWHEYYLNSNGNAVSQMQHSADEVRWPQVDDLSGFFRQPEPAVRSWR